MEPYPPKQFVIGNDGLRDIKMRYMRASFIFFFGIPVLIVINDIATPKHGNVDTTQIASYVLLVVFYTAAVVATIVAQRRNIDKLYREYTITLNHELIEKRVHNYQRIVVIKAPDIIQVRRMYNGDLYVDFEAAFLFIPRQIENRDELEILLAGLGAPFTAGPYNFIVRHLNRVLQMAAGLMIAELVVDNKAFVIADSIILTCFILIMFIRGKRKSLNKALFKRFALFYLLAIAVIIFILVTKLLS